MDCIKCVQIFAKIGEAFNAPISVKKALEQVAKALVDFLELKACHFRLLSRDQKILEDVASHGLSEKFLSKGPVDAERSVAEALKGASVMVEDCSNDPRIQYPVEFAEEGIVSLLTVPLSGRGQVIGVMRLSTPQRREFTEQELNMIEVVASFCTTAIIHSMFHEILKMVNEAIGQSLELDVVTNGIVQVVSESLRTKGATIQLVDRKQRLELRATYGLSDTYCSMLEQEPGEAVTRALQGKTVPVLDAKTDPLNPHRDQALREGVSSILYVPMMLRGNPIGVLGVHTHRQYEFSGDELGLMKAIADQCALAIRNAQTYAGLKGRYEALADEFQLWFEHNAYSTAKPE